MLVPRGAKPSGHLCYAPPEGTSGLYFLGSRSVLLVIVTRHCSGSVGRPPNAFRGHELGVRAVSNPDEDHSQMNEGDQPG